MPPIQDSYVQVPQYVKLPKTSFSLPLKYLFTCLYDDGTTFEQTMEDKSVKDSTKGAYFDIDHARLTAFALYGPVGLPDNQQNVYVVNLRNGVFAVNNVPFRLHEEGEVTGPFRLEYWLRGKVHQSIGDVNMSRHERVYRFGWSADGVVFKMREGKRVGYPMRIERIMEIE